MKESQKFVMQNIQERYKGAFMLSKRETASEIRVSEMTIDRLRKEGDISSTKIGGQIFFSIVEISRFLTKDCRE